MAVTPYPGFGTTLASGAIAGLAVDISLFPLDTIKTRLQSAAGFWHSGGFCRMYSGLGSVIVGSSPSAAVFFCTYEMVKTLTQSSGLLYHFQSLSHMGAASCGEAVSCLVRVPTEIVKQRAQADSKVSSWKILLTTIHNEGFRGMYRGYFSTIFREIPFSFIQFPIWEHLKNTWSLKQGYYVRPWQSSICGAIAGSIAATVTTPLDVAKTRIMLAKKGTTAAEGYIVDVLKSIWREKGFYGLFAGFIPRVLWISIGGAVFLGVYEKSKTILMEQKIL